MVDFNRIFSAKPRFGFAIGPGASARDTRFQRGENQRAQEANRGRATAAGFGFAFSPGSARFQQVASSLRGLGVAPSAVTRQGGGVDGRFTAEQVARGSLLFSPPPAAPAGPAAAPEADPSIVRDAAARQDAADKFSQPVVAGRREALLTRRGRGKGLASLGRGFSARNALTTVPV